MDTLSPHDQNDNIPLKCCVKCGKTFPATSDFFNRNKAYKDGLTSACRTCRKAYAVQYNREHREEKNAKARAHYSAHRERIQATYIRPYHQSHKEEIRAYRKRWMKEHRESSRLYSQQYYQLHRKQLIARATAYIQNNRERHHRWCVRYSQTLRGHATSRSASHKRRAQLKAIPGAFTAQEFAEQVKRQKNKCYWCGKKLTNIHADHIIPISRPGSTNSIDNIVAACSKCNLKRSNRYPHEWPEGGRLL